MAGIYRKIVVPLDGSPMAQCVLTHLSQLAIPGETTLALVHVIDPSRYAMAVSRYTPPDFWENLRISADTYIAEQQNLLRASGYQVDAYVVNGDAAASILQVAGVAQADLIAMTTHGRSGFVAWALGSVAERVVSESGVPVFLVRAATAQRASFRRILTPLDGSALAEQALSQAGALAQAANAELVLLQVVERIGEEDRPILFQSAGEAETALAQWQGAASAYLESVAEPLRVQGIRCTSQVVTGDVASSIVAAAQAGEVDLLVMSTHGRSGLQRWVYGSVAGKVLHGAACPLLLIRYR